MEIKKLKPPIDSVLLWVYVIIGLIFPHNLVPRDDLIFGINFGVNYGFLDIIEKVLLLALFALGVSSMLRKKSFVCITIGIRVLLNWILLIGSVVWQSSILKEYASWGDDFYKERLVSYIHNDIACLLCIFADLCLLFILIVFSFPRFMKYSKYTEKLKLMPSILICGALVAYYNHPTLVRLIIDTILYVIFAVAYYLLIDRMIEPYRTVTAPLLKNTQNGEVSSADLSREYAEIYCEMPKHILLCLFTFGVWYLIWIYKATRYLNRAPGGEQYDPTKKLLLCMFVPFYQIYWFYKHGQKLDSLMKARKLGGSDMATLCLILGIFIPVVACILMQDKFNQLCTVNVAAQQEEVPTPTERDAIDNLERYKDLLDKGVITQEEFDAKKKQLLGL